MIKTHCDICDSIINKDHINNPYYVLTKHYKTLFIGIRENDEPLDICGDCVAAIKEYKRKRENDLEDCNNGES